MIGASAGLALVGGHRPLRRHGIAPVEGAATTMTEMQRATPKSGPCDVRPPGPDLARGPADYSSGCEKGAAPRRRNPLNWMAPRPGLEPGTCGLTVRRSTN